MAEIEIDDVTNLMQKFDTFYLHREVPISFDKVFLHQGVDVPNKDYITAQKARDGSITIKWDSFSAVKGAELSRFAELWREDDHARKHLRNLEKKFKKMGFEVNIEERFFDNKNKTWHDTDSTPNRIPAPILTLKIPNSLDSIQTVKVVWRKDLVKAAKIECATYLDNVKKQLVDSLGESDGKLAMQDVLASESIVQAKKTAR